MKHLIFTSTLMVIEYKQHSDSQTVNTRIPYSWNVIVLQKKKAQPGVRKLTRKQEYFISLWF